MTAPVRSAAESLAFVAHLRSGLSVADARARLVAERFHLDEAIYQAAQARLTADAVAAGEEAGELPAVVDDGDTSTGFEPVDLPPADPVV